MTLTVAAYEIFERAYSREHQGPIYPCDVGQQGGRGHCGKCSKIGHGREVRFGDQRNEQDQPVYLWTTNISDIHEQADERLLTWAGEKNKKQSQRNSRAEKVP
jgi:hypothetical protein